MFLILSVHFPNVQKYNIDLLIFLNLKTIFNLLTRFFASSSFIVAIITLTTDLGSKSHYLSIIKGMLLSSASRPDIVDISHDCEPFDIIESAYVFKLVYDYFPENTIHIFSIDYNSAQQGRILCAKHRNHYFIFPDNGALSLVFSEVGIAVWEVAKTPLPPFAIASILVKAAIQLMQNDYKLDQLFNQLDKFHKVGAIKPVVTDNKLIGTILFNDSYGNAHTNISKEEFEKFTSNKKFRINLSRHEWIEEVNTSFAHTKGGDSVGKFNNKDLLMIGVNRGKATQLLNLTKNKTISIDLL
jgi:S-adenosylmethionine hydrolase